MSSSPDLNDRHMAGEVIDLFAGEEMPPETGPDEAVLAMLEPSGAENPKPKGIYPSIVRVLQNDHRWMGKVRWNEFAASVELHYTPVAPGRVVRAADEYDSYVRSWLYDNYLQMTVPRSEVTEAIYAIAKRHSYHPVRAYLRGLEWDGVPRMGGLFATYFGAEANDLTASVSSCFLRSCVARVLRPGCKVDTMPILLGRQGAFKSSGLRALAVRSDWFADTRLDLGSKDLFEQLQGRWIYEIAELDAFRGRENSRIKALMSSQEDNYRRPYGHHAISVARQVVFAGTTNEDEFLTDQTGSRRFWSVKVGVIDLEAIERDRDQLWAEAVASFDAGDPWWLSGELAQAAEAANDEHRNADAWEPRIEAYLVGRVEVGVDEVLEHAVRKPVDTWNQNDKTRVATTLKALRWTRHKLGTTTRTVRWRRPAA